MNAAGWLTDKRLSIDAISANIRSVLPPATGERIAAVGAGPAGRTALTSILRT